MVKGGGHYGLIMVGSLCDHLLTEMWTSSKHYIRQLVRPHVEYANVVSHPRYKEEVEQLVKVQRLATKIVCALRYVPSTIIFSESSLS